MKFETRALCGAVCSAAALLSASACDGGGWFRRSVPACESCTPPAPVCEEPACKPKSWRPTANLADPPLAPVVSSMPIINIPVTAVALPTQAVNVTAVGSSPAGLTAERIKQLRELAAAMDAPVAGKPPAAAAAATMSAEEEQALRTEIQALRTQIQQLKSALKIE